MTNGQSSVKMPPRPRVVVLGAGFAGLNAALALGDMAVDVTVIDRRNHHTFQPLLYQVATASLSPADIASPIRGILHKLSNVRVILGDVSAIDLDVEGATEQGLHPQAGACVAVHRAGP